MLRNFSDLSQQSGEFLGLFLPHGWAALSGSAGATFTAATVLVFPSMLLPSSEWYPLTGDLLLGFSFGSYDHRRVERFHLGGVLSHRYTSQPFFLSYFRSEVEFWTRHACIFRSLFYRNCFGIIGSLTGEIKHLRRPSLPPATAALVAVGSRT